MGIQFSCIWILGISVNCENFDTGEGDCCFAFDRRDRSNTKVVAERFFISCKFPRACDIHSYVTCSEQAAFDVGVDVTALDWQCFFHLGKFFQTFNGTVVVQTDIIFVCAVFTEQVAAGCSNECVSIVHVADFPHNSVFVLSFVSECFTERKNVIERFRGF
ncbi:hypothetical protein D3C73_1109070 [compost metagenome]